MTQLTLVSNSKNNIDLILAPEKTGDATTIATIEELISASEYTALHVNAGNIKNAIAELNDVLKPLSKGAKGREIKYQILERRDATISITIDKDEMGASAEITTALGGKHLSAKDILAAGQAAGIKKGFSKDDLIQLAQLAAKEEPGTFVSLAIASGKQPTNGKNAKIKLLVQSAQERILRPKEREDGTVDMRDLGDIICVKVGDSLAKKIPLTLGTNGYTVTATPIPPTPGEDIKLTPGNGTSISTRDENLLISRLVGLPKIIDNGMEVDEVYKIKNVDVSTGNITFTGSVIIEGDVCEGMKVIASGDITVAGFVESATLQADGDITIGGGIIGRKQDVENSQITDLQMSVSVTAKGKVFAKYCQYAELTCDNDVHIENQMMHSNVKVNGRLWLGEEEKANGKLIGGYIRAKTSVNAGFVGATAGSNTIINFESEVLKYKESLLDLDTRLKIETDKTKELDVAKAKLNKLPKEKINPEIMKKITTTYNFHLSRMGELLAEKESIEEDLLNYMNSVYVEATDKLYHGVEVIIGDFKDRTRREYGPSRMMYNERKILIDPIVHS